MKINSNFYSVCYFRWRRGLVVNQLGKGVSGVFGVYLFLLS
jgi:hypothetical protein